jgi:type I restriction enzyme, R subunit
VNNFSFLSPSWSVLTELGELSERNLYIDPNTSLIKLRMFSEVLAKYLLAYEKLDDPIDGSQVSRINILSNNGIIPDQLLPLFHSLRKIGNKATHEGFGTIESAQTHLQFAYRLAAWFRQTYGKDEYIPQEFKLPQKSLIDAQQLLILNEELQRQSKKLEEDYNRLQVELEALKIVDVTAESKTIRRKLSARVANQMHLSEAETRLLIDEQLNTAGWLADSQNIRYSKGARCTSSIIR